MGRDGRSTRSSGAGIAARRGFDPEAIRNIPVSLEGVHEDIHAALDHRAQLIGAMANRTAAEAASGIGRSGIQTPSSSEDACKVSPLPPRPRP